MGRPVVHFEIDCRGRGKTGWQAQENGPATMLSTGGKAGIGGHLTRKSKA